LCIFIKDWNKWSVLLFWTHHPHANTAFLALHVGSQTLWMILISTTTLYCNVALQHCEFAFVIENWTIIWHCGRWKPKGYLHVLSYFTFILLQNTNHFNIILKWKDVKRKQYNIFLLKYIGICIWIASLNALKYSSIFDIKGIGGFFVVAKIISRKR
jgi:hypothetical protein